MAKTLAVWQDEKTNEYYYIGSLTDIQVKKLLALKKIDPKVGLDFLENKSVSYFWCCFGLL